MGLATRPGAGKGRKNGTVKALMPSCYTGRQEGIRANLTAVSMEEARCRALFLALFTPMLTTLGNVPRLRARSAHSVSHLPPSSWPTSLVDLCLIWRVEAERWPFA